MTGTTCNCGTNATSASTGSIEWAKSEPCTCGCCGPPAAKEQQLADLRRQREAVDRRIAELEVSS
jgi:hypothetical protein